MIYPLSFPSQAPATQKLVLNRRQSVAESPWTFKQQTVQTASQWVLEWTWPAMTFAKAEAIDGWLQGLKGQVGTFRYAPVQRYSYATTGTTLATAAFNYQDTITVKGWGANLATSLRVGQFFQIGDQLLQIIEAGAFADASGTITLTFAPELRKNFAVGTAVNFVNPVGVFRLATSDGHGFTLTPDRIPEFGTIQAREAV